MKPKRLKNVQQKPKQYWFDFSEHCPNCIELAKQALNKRGLNWRYRNDKFEVRGADKDSVTRFLYSQGVGKHE